MKTPLIAIVGRPNVGKSTLFNRLIKERKAIVDKQPGITRDRVYATTVWNGMKFTLVDTGGYVPELTGKMEREIKVQVEEALLEADKILFVLDGSSMITDLDVRIGRMLLKSNKETIVVVNKIDNEARESAFGEFYRLGFTEIIPVSAMVGRNTGDLMDLIVKNLHVSEKDKAGDEVQYIKIAVVGKPNVGKSSLINAIIGEERLIVTDIPGTTIDSVDLNFKKDNKHYKIVDTAGIRKKKKIQENVEYYSSLRTIKSIEQSNVVIIMTDARDGVRSQELKIIEMCEKSGKGMVLALNKWDLIEKDEKTFDRAEQKAREKLKTKNYVPIISISALTKKRIFKIIELCETVFQEGQRKIATSRFNDFLITVIRKKQPPAYKGKRITIKYGCQTGILPPRFEFFTNDYRGIRPDYVRYLENSIRAEFGFAGFPIKLNFKKKSRSKHG